MKLDERSVHAIGVPKRYRECTFETWTGKIPLVVKAWDEKSNLVLWGPTGTGKTHLATARFTASARALISPVEHEPARKYVCWQSTRGLLEDLKQGFGTDYDPLPYYCGVPILLLDDIGAEALSGDKSDWRRDRISYVIAERYDRMLPSIVTTNLGPTEMLEFDARLSSRLFGGQVAKLDGDDWRWKRGKAS